MAAPSWYDTRDHDFNVISFNNSIKSTIKKANKIMTDVFYSTGSSSSGFSSSHSSSSSSSGGGHSSGGGSSGEGSSGGGGSSC